MASLSCRLLCCLSAALILNLVSGQSSVSSLNQSVASMTANATAGGQNANTATVTPSPSQNQLMINGTLSVASGNSVNSVAATAATTATPAMQTGAKMTASGGATVTASGGGGGGGGGVTVSRGTVSTSPKAAVSSAGGKSGNVSVMPTPSSSPAPTSSPAPPAFCHVESPSKSLCQSACCASSGLSGLKSANLTLSCTSHNMTSRHVSIGCHVCHNHCTKSAAGLLKYNVFTFAMTGLIYYFAQIL